VPIGHVFHTPESHFQGLLTINGRKVENISVYTEYANYHHKKPFSIGYIR